MSTVKKYRKKPVEIEAWQWTKPREAEQIIDWIQTDSEEENETFWDEDVSGRGGPEGEDWGDFTIDTLEGLMSVAPFDYVIRGAFGEFYACHPGVFATTYEEVR